MAPVSKDLINFSTKASCKTEKSTFFSCIFYCSAPYTIFSTHPLHSRWRQYAWHEVTSCFQNLEESHLMLPEPWGKSPHASRTLRMGDLLFLKHPALSWTSASLVSSPLYTPSITLCEPEQVNTHNRSSQLHMFNGNTTMMWQANQHASFSCEISKQEVFQDQNLTTVQEGWMTLMIVSSCPGRMEEASYNILQH